MKLIFFVGDKHSRFVRMSVGERVKPCHLNQQAKHPPQKMFWGCFSYKGIGSLFPVQGMMKSDQYIEVLRRKLIPDMQKAFSGDAGIFQQDLAPCHCSKKVKKFLSDNNIAVLKWLGNLPDLNPIENRWAIEKKKYRNMTAPPQPSWLRL